MSSWFEKASNVAIEKFKAELEEKASFVKNSNMPEEIGKALFKYGFALEDIKYVEDAYEKPNDTMAFNCDHTYLEERVMRISSPTFDKNSLGWNPYCTKEQQRFCAVEMLGHSLVMMDCMQEQNKSGVISLPPFIVRTLLKNVPDENDITPMLNDRIAKITKLDDCEIEDIRYEAIVTKYKDIIVRLTKGYGADMKPITHALLKNDVKTSVIASFMAGLDYDHVTIPKSLFLTICKISLQN